MKRCPTCHRTETDDSLAFCRSDGTALVIEPDDRNAEARTIQLDPGITQDNPTAVFETAANRKSHLKTGEPRQPSIGTQRITTGSRNRKLIFASLAALVLVLTVGSYLILGRKANSGFDSIAVLPFENQNRDSDADYLADGLTKLLQKMGYRI